MSSRFYFTCSALLMAFYIAGQAAGAHLLAALLSAKDHHTFLTATHFLFVGAVSIAISEFLSKLNLVKSYFLSLAFLSFTLVFSGTLFAYLVFKWSFLVHLTPLGGAGLMMTWLYFAFKLSLSKRV